MAPALLAAVDCTAHVHLIIGSNSLAGARCSRSLEVGAKPIIVASEAADPATPMHYGVIKRIEEDGIQWMRRDFQDGDLNTLGREDVDRVVDAVFITSGGSSPNNTRISTLCRRMRIPVNVADAPTLCSFTTLSTHTQGPLQIGVTTSGRGCKLAARIRREIAASLPSDFGNAIERLGVMRRRILEEDQALGPDLGADDDETGQTASFNKLVLHDSDVDAAKSRRMRWLGQICEYWPLSRLAAIKDGDVEKILQAYRQEATSQSDPNSTFEPKFVNGEGPKKKGSIILAGSGPGHPSLLTTATLTAIARADVVLADKLVPAGVLALIPRRTAVHIARKFPGNADAAQDELHTLAASFLAQGQTVLRLKQGDPYLYGRGAEEVLFFRARGHDPLVIPGVTSALAAPLFAGIPPTHRAVSEQVIICTGTAQRGTAPNAPGYSPKQTVVFLMALHRLRGVCCGLFMHEDAPYPLQTPCAVVERASCPDQRVIRTTLQFVTTAVEEEGARPPGVLVVGAACEVLFPNQDGAKKWVVEDGFRGLDALGEVDGLDGLKEAFGDPRIGLPDGGRVANGGADGSGPEELEW